MASDRPLESSYLSMDREAELAASEALLLPKKGILYKLEEHVYVWLGCCSSDTMIVC